MAATGEQTAAELIWRVIRTGGVLCFVVCPLATPAFTLYGRSDELHDPRPPLKGGGQPTLD